MNRQFLKKCLVIIFLNLIIYITIIYKPRAAVIIAWFFENNFYYLSLNSFDIGHCFSQFHSWESWKRILPFFLFSLLFFFYIFDLLVERGLADRGEIRRSECEWHMSGGTPRLAYPPGPGWKLGHFFLLVTHRRERHSRPGVAYCNRSNTDRMFFLAGADSGGNRYDFGTQCRVIASRRVLRTRRFPSYHPHDRDTR